MIEKIISDVIDKCCSYRYAKTVYEENETFIIIGEIGAIGLSIKFLDKRIGRSELVEYYYFDFNDRTISNERYMLEPTKVTTTYYNKIVNMFVPAKTKTIPKKLIATKTKSIFGVLSRSDIVTEYTEQESREVMDLDLLRFDAEQKIPDFLTNIKQRVQLNTIFINSRRT